MVEVCVFRVATTVDPDDLIALIADLVGVPEKSRVVSPQWGAITVGDDSVEIAIAREDRVPTVRPYVAELVADLAAFGVSVTAMCDALDVASAAPEMATLDKALLVCRMFEEVLIGCVIGCGCEEPGWSSPEAIADLRQWGSFPWYRSEVDAYVSPRATLRWLDYAFEHAAERDVAQIHRSTGRRHASVEAFRAHLAPLCERLRIALSSELR